MAQFNTNVPSFYRVEERDIVMPAEARLQVDLFDYQDAFGEAINGEKLIGSTMIDLEDRWHSASWRDAMDRRQQIPTENRALINPQLSGQNCGSTLEYPWRIFGIFGMEPFFWVKGCQSEAVPMACTGVEYVHASEW